MVNHGPSSGCLTCRKRRVKCDTRKPWCKACLRLGIECAGYLQPRLKFKDETAHHQMKLLWKGTLVRQHKHNHQPILLTTSKAAIVTLPTSQPQDLAVPFFLTYVTDVGRSLESSRGFLEFIRPVLITERHDSALSIAVTAVAVKLWKMVGYHRVTDSLPRQLLCRALKTLHKATEDPQERLSDATVLAALVLQIYDTLSAVLSQTKAHGRHRHGALALLLQRPNGLKKSKYHAHIVANLFHSKVSSCTRSGKPFTSEELRWIETEAIPILPLNPSSLLDTIGAAIVQLQHTFFRPSANKGLSPYEQANIQRELQSLEERLCSWPGVVPALWRPKNVHIRDGIDSSIQAYHGAFDIYPSIQTANIWNTWRIYLVILGKMKLDILQRGPHGGGSGLKGHEERSEGEIRNTVNAICYSIPFYLGNRTRPGAPFTTGIPGWLLPSYHDLSCVDEGFLRYRASDQYVPKVDHSRHVMLHGPLHVMSILSTIIDLFSGRRLYRKAGVLLGYQRFWIAKQFIRALDLMQPGLINMSRLDTKPDGTYDKQEANDLIVEAEALSMKVNEELWTVTVL
ncbi:transcriptional regulatory moc3 [Fusarium heterosporum]|uniref:Transcriptional regulatory moc3 n=1 Tax=Fusarium heterosporum TaxID=42747 RepID=A0A8H5WLI2_FUSHE|nr:transcriptional regulatory moc3 [Fusarium heterosporum]